MQSQLIIADPGHFHAALLQKQMYPGLSPRVSVYAPLGPDVLDYLKRISLFNSRSDNPTHWQLDVHLSEDAIARMLTDRPGNVSRVVYSSVWCRRGFNGCAGEGCRAAIAMAGAGCG